MYASVLVFEHWLTASTQLPDNIQDTIEAGSQTANILTHCRRELMHKVWDRILDNDFTQAYEHGFTMECLDGVWRRFYPRTFTYSADYPEKYVASVPAILDADPIPQSPYCHSAQPRNLSMPPMPCIQSRPSQAWANYRYEAPFIHCTPVHG